MSRNTKFVLALGIILLAVFFVSRSLADDDEEIANALQELNQPMTDIKHIEFLDSNEAIAFYEWEDETRYFGQALMRKGVLGWTFNGGSTSQVDPEIIFSLSFSNLEYDSSTHTDLISGIIGHPDIETMKVETDSGHTYEATIIEYDTTERLWFLLTDGDNTMGSTVTGLSENGEVIYQSGI